MLIIFKDQIRVSKSQSCDAPSDGQSPEKLKMEQEGFHQITE